MILLLFNPFLTSELIFHSICMHKICSWTHFYNITCSTCDRDELNYIFTLYCPRCTVLSWKQITQDVLWCCVMSTVCWTSLRWQLMTFHNTDNTPDGARRDYSQKWWPCWHWSSLHERRWRKRTGDAYLMLEKIIWFYCLTDRNPAATVLPLQSSHILTWSQSINQFWGFVCIFVSCKFSM